jgi:hypothetical protein
MREPADRLMIVSNGTLDLYVYACDLIFQRNNTDVSQMLSARPHPPNLLPFTAPVLFLALSRSFVVPCTGIRITIHTSSGNGQVLSDNSPIPLALPLHIHAQNTFQILTRMHTFSSPTSSGPGS